MLNMNPMAPLACEFLAEIVKEGLSLGLGKTKPAYGERNASAARVVRGNPDIRWLEKPVRLVGCGFCAVCHVVCCLSCVVCHVLGCGLWAVGCVVFCIICVRCALCVYFYPCNCVAINCTAVTTPKVQ